MAAEVYEDLLSIEIELLEAIPPSKSSYPYPELRSTATRETRDFKTVVLENSYVRATLVPDLGGRILSLFDKGVSKEILEHNPLLALERYGPRGVALNDGIQILLHEQSRHNSLGPVSVMAESGSEEAAVWIGETAGPISFNARISLADDEAALRIEVRAFNRTLRRQPYNGGMAIGNPDAETYGGAGDCLVWRTSACDGLLISSQQETRLSPSARATGADLTRLPIGTKFYLAPRQLDTWCVMISPILGFESPPQIGVGVAISVNDRELTVRASRPIADAKLVVRTTDGRTLESPCDLSPSETKTIELPEGTCEAAILDKSGSALIVADRSGPSKFAVSTIEIGSAGGGSYDDVESKLATVFPSVRAAAYLKLATESHLQGDLDDAERRVEQSLLYNGDDHLAWWFKAVFKRLSVGESDGSELLNAHYLAPLEPALRMESFLALPAIAGRERNPMLSPLAEQPEQLVECASLLIEHGLIPDASRWIEEALRHADIAMLHYLQAWLLTKHSKMSVEAASHMSAAAKLPFGPPYPWRESERAALQGLVTLFPNDQTVSNYAKLAAALV